MRVVIDVVLSRSRSSTRVHASELQTFFSSAAEASRPVVTRPLRNYMRDALSVSPTCCFAMCRCITPGNGGDPRCNTVGNFALLANLSFLHLGRSA